jgi:uncharacterized damage-inducible protein DinB
MIYENNALLEIQINFWRQDIKSTIEQALERTPDDRLDWAPLDGMITLGNIFLHISETSDWWFDEVMNGKKSVELVPQSASATPPKPVIKKHMDDHWARLERLFSRDPDVLDKNYQYTGRTKTVTVSGFWIYNHLLEHDVHHRSQINQYLRILGVEPPEI